jgi:hypothetical protein
MSSTKIDVSLNVYGKPYQTALTIRSLLKYSGQYVGKIFITLEKNQPEGFSEELLKSLLADLPIDYYTPRMYLGLYQKFRRDWIVQGLLRFPFYRHSIRYQYAWEKTKAKYLFVTHNDMVYHADVLGGYLSNLKGRIAVGHVGQCWNCPAFEVKCDGSKYWDYRPDKQEVHRLYDGWKVDRAISNGQMEDHIPSWPLPECRLNEQAALIDMEIARPITVPQGSCAPIGTMTMDTGVKWFKEISLEGYQVSHDSYFNYARHGMFNSIGSGQNSLFDRELYDHEEKMAKEMLEKANY